VERTGYYANRVESLLVAPAHALTQFAGVGCYDRNSIDEPLNTAIEAPTLSV
jgi:hypothetical protein